MFYDRITHMSQSKTKQYDVLILGSGAAGLSAALHLQPHLSVAVISKAELNSGNTSWAQGGISAVLDRDDSLAQHIEDTISAGAGLCDPEVVEKTVSEGREVIDWLLSIGVEFTREKAFHNRHHLHLTQEGGHTHRRVAHVADATGDAVQNQLITQVRQREQIDLLSNHIAVDLITAGKLGHQQERCVGAYILNLDTGRVEVFRSQFVILATGGASKVYLYTSNPDGACGDGIAMAWRAGCRVANMEFMQFHPTCLYHPHAKSFLITEALRGEGAFLELPDGTRFMTDFDDLAELAPRDIVARAIDHEMKRLGCDCVYLNITHKPSEFIKAHFPNIFERCLRFGIDITRDRIPVVPAAHYTCGGVMVNIQGETDVSNLYAIGETSFSGLHGANRMASNSLLECFVIAFGAADSIRSRFEQTALVDHITQWDESRVTDSDDEILVSHDWDEIRRFMWDFVGIVRTSKRLQRARSRISVIREEVRDYYIKHRVTNDNLELRNLALVAELIINSALQRQESRGLHFTLDFPDTLAHAKDTILSPETH